MVTAARRACSGPRRERANRFGCAHSVRERIVREPIVREPIVREPIVA
jgi:hypothetical protein